MEINMINFILKWGRLNQINYIIIPSDKQLVSVRSLCLYEFSREKTTALFHYVFYN